jgi:hypothetical protein
MNDDARLELEPGILPTRPAPISGERITISVTGLPPFKDTKFSIRNRKHPHHEAFARLRREAARIMAGRRWYDGPVAMKLTLRGNALDKPLVDYSGGVMDSLDGSHGDTFTYLPIVFQDDCQVFSGEYHFVKDSETSYTVEITFM